MGTELFSLLGRISIDNSEANDEIDGTTERAKNSSSKMTESFKKIGKAVATFFVVDKIAQFGSYLMELGESTLEMAGNQAKLSASLKDTGHSATYMEETYKNLYGYLGDDMAVTNTILNMEKLGLSQKETTALTDSAIAVWTAYGDSIPLEGLAESINETVMVGQVTGSLADALNWAGISEDDFNEKLKKCTSEQERAKLITETLNGEYGKSKKEYDELSEKSRAYQESQAELQLAQTKLGQAMLPVNTAMNTLKSTIANALIPVISELGMGVEKLTEWFQGLPKSVQTIITIVGVLIGLFGSAISIVGVLSRGITLLTSGFGILGTVFGTIKIGAGVVAVAIGGISTPVMIIISVITALIAIGVSLYRNWDTIKSKAIESWNSICNTISNAMNKAKNVVSNGLNAIQSFFSKCKLSFPKIKLPHFSISGKLSLDPPSVPKINVKWYAKGGVMTKPTIFGSTGNTLLGGGEIAGGEAILPIDSFYNHLDNYLDKKMSGNYNVNFNFENIKIQNEQDIEKLAKVIDQKFQQFVNRKTKMQGGVIIV